MTIYNYESRINDKLLKFIRLDLKDEKKFTIIIVNNLTNEQIIGTGKYIEDKTEISLIFNDININCEINKLDISIRFIKLYDHNIFYKNIIMFDDKHYTYLDKDTRFLKYFKDLLLKKK